jgi:hypothetical protein
MLQSHAERLADLECMCQCQKPIQYQSSQAVFIYHAVSRGAEIKAVQIESCAA